ncbi:MAG: methionine synthase, partial [Selenomonadales bacterium]|nr:methionine synthase [Selenomonadales bacterium]
MKYRIPIPTLDVHTIRRYAGLKSSDFPPERMREAAQTVRLLAEGVGSIRYYPYDSTTHTIIAESGDLSLTSDAICRHLAEAEEVAVMAVTVGSAVEEAIDSAFSAGEYSRALLLDAAATTATEACADYLNRTVTAEAKRRGLYTAFRFSPGYGDWDITVQSDIVRLSEGDSIGITVTESSMLIPRKSVTAVIPLRAQKAEALAHGCS